MRTTTAVVLLGTSAWAAQIPTQIPLGATQPPLRMQDHTQNYTFDALLHMPGISPYFDAVGFGLEHKAPLGCKVTAASYLVRHASIYANDNDYENFLEPFLSEWEKGGKNWTGPLSVLNEWESPYDDIEKQMEQLTPAGAEESTEVARHLLQRYPELVPTTTKVYSDKKDRTRDTAKAFIKAFPQNVTLEKISEHGEFHAVVPHKSCKKFSKAAGDKEQEIFAYKYTKGTIVRLQPHAPFELEAKHIVGLQQLCGYESAITGKLSKLCDIFTPIEWMSYEYLWDLKYFYMVGPGNPLSHYLGFPWLNVTAELFSTLHEEDGASTTSKEDDGQRFFVSFTHREVPPFLATALGIFDSASTVDDTMPTDRINFPRSWKMAELVPFLGHIGIEKMACGPDSGAVGGTEFIRVLANSAPRPIPKCQSGPGASCELHEFQKFTLEGLKTYGDFDKVCENGKDEKGRDL
ncbi:putative Histidine acid phosphatase-like protein [Seiridium cardinale]